MDTHDTDLIRRAHATHYTEWHAIGQLIPMAHSREARRLLRAIRSAKYHTEEWHARTP